MCIIIDTNTFSPVFDTKNKDHDSFSPVLKWIITGKGKVVYGGTKYKKELQSAKKYLSVFLEIKKAGKIVEINDAKVDAKQREVDSVVDDARFNDSHLVALALVSGCMLICTSEREAIPYIKKDFLYEGCKKRPRIYSSKRNCALLTDAYIANICKPTQKISCNLQANSLHSIATLCGQKKLTRWRHS